MIIMTVCRVNLIITHAQKHNYERLCDWNLELKSTPYSTALICFVDISSLMRKFLVNFWIIVNYAAVKNVQIYSTKTYIECWQQTSFLSRLGVN